MPDRAPAAVTGLSLCVATVSSLLTPYNPTVYLGVGTPNTWHSPTQLIAMVWMLICVPYTARCYDRFEAALPDPRANSPWREGALLGALLLVSLTAKPTFMQAFLPAACQMCIRDSPYMQGDKVTHGGKTWVSAIDNNIWEPGVYGGEEDVYKRQHIS